MISGRTEDNLIAEIRVILETKFKDDPQECGV